MTGTADRLDLRLSAEDKNLIRRAATLSGIPVAAFVREVALREADAVLARRSAKGAGSLSDRLRGRATARMTTDEIMQLTRGV